MVLERVQKIIGEAGYCSRRKAEEFIIDGRVTVNGKKITIGDKADASKDEIKVGSHLIKKKKKIYLMINKPRGYITTSDDMYDRRKVTDLVSDINERIFAVGRLDRDASGLLLMTNDGTWGNKIMHPRYNIEKEYLVKLNDSLNKEIIKKMNAGIKLKDGFIKPRVKMISKDYCSIVLHEGKNKIVKRIFNEFGVRVTQLKRIRIGDYYLGNLKPGKWKEIKP